MQVHGDHRIDPEGADRMVLTEHPGSGPIVVAERADGCCGDAYWTVKADGAKDVAVRTRDEAVTAMLDMALQVLPGDGYATFIPHSLRELP